MNDNKKRVLVACSGGPDSLALLDMSKDFYEVYVAHVNYHKRKTANRDERIVKDYCLKHNLPFYKSDYKDTKGGNFQDKARVFRYDFFRELVKELKLEMVLVAHHQDDLIETYLLQIKRGITPSYYGLKKDVDLNGLKVRRPLLKYSKQDLVDYCLKNDLKYGVDESNLTDDYDRNKIRHQVLDKMSKAEKKEIIKEINQKNKYHLTEINKAKKYLNKRKRISLDEFDNYENKEYLLKELLGVSVSNKELIELLRQIKQSKSFETCIKDYYLVKEYGYLETYKKCKDYSYTLKEIKYFKSDYFKLAKKGTSKQGVSLKEEDFPITIRNYHQGDFIVMRYGTKKLNRFFIDNKISSFERKIWPVLVNAKGSVILVPEIGCDINRYSPKHNLYMVKL